ncbi:hypothetical protein [Nocardia grenadensis]|uniref:hypothetical protein n=1 Tax=Nocardia grenadensis TaxID=931537 RepID=UPI0007A4CAB4|nr:hypothetical protein [Nocardia grenadensis]
MKTTTRFTAAATLVFAVTTFTVGVASATPTEPTELAAPAVVSDAGDSIDAAGDHGTPSTPLDRGAEIDKAVAAVGGAYAAAKGDGQLFGTAAGIIVGCPLGAVTGGSLTMLVSAGALTPLGVVGGCILGGGALGFLGGTIGGAVTGLPALAAAATEQYNGLQSKGLVSAPIAMPSS